MIPGHTLQRMFPRKNEATMNVIGPRLGSMNSWVRGYPLSFITLFHRQLGSAQA